jgi:hypothetical protein
VRTRNLASRHPCRHRTPMVDQPRRCAETTQSPPGDRPLNSTTVDPVRGEDGGAAGHAAVRRYGAAGVHARALGTERARVGAVRARPDDDRHAQDSDRSRPRRRLPGRCGWGRQRASVPSPGGRSMRSARSGLLRARVRRRTRLEHRGRFLARQLDTAALVAELGPRRVADGSGSSDVGPTQTLIGSLIGWSGARAAPEGGSP